MAEERTISTWRNPFDEGFSICRYKKITFHQGITVLVGCNGIGKTTTIDNIISELKKENIPYYKYDNLRDGGSAAISREGFFGNYDFIAQNFSASEGEQISNNIGLMASKLRKFILTGEVDTRGRRLKKSLREISGGEEEVEIPPERWILLDAVDSGYSVDNVVELKDLCRLILEDASSHNIDLYIIISANAYEMARDADCMDVTTGKYLRFKDYEDYRDFVLRSRERKDKRYEARNTKD